ncbi:hypothetical protein KR093_001770 [Drosophila rubida]|uniref:Uncharacterized protein n=1 Tax=Drosophila rubida TaxID=30044 RepID=A0AAD4JZW5_9MUSC|nr:hypothetical protein KR093_001770 [Drosophila rubida]
MDSDSSFGAAALADDSGLFSCSSEAETEDATNHSTTWPGEKEMEPEHRDSLFLVTQELRKSRSEVERLSKSEQWYKQELQSQKHNRLETLERLYAQERKYMLENQRLQQESLQLQAKCTTLQGVTQPAAMATTLPLVAAQPLGTADDFEAEQQQARLMDQRQLIEVLRRQKKGLLEDIQRLSLDNDDKLLELQAQLAGVELENKHMTRQCKQLLDEQRELAHKLELKASTLHNVAAERDQLRQVIAELNETLQTQEQLLALKEREFLELKQHYQEKLSSECSIDAMHSYSLAFHGEINAKTSEIASLKHALHDLQTELLLMSQLQAQNEEQQRQLEQLNFQLEAQQLEQALKDARLEDLTTEKAALADQLQETQQTVHNLEQQLAALQMQYVETCTKCEHTKTQLDAQQSQNKEQQQQLTNLREQLALYVQQCSQLSDAMLQTEYKLEQQQHKKAEDQCTQTQAADSNSSELEERIATLEEQLEAVKNQKQQTVGLLQQLLQQQDAKIKNTNEMEADWVQLLEALQATQQMEQQVQLQLQQKAEELHQLNELFAQQNEQLQQLQLLSQTHETQSSNELQQLKQAQAADAVALSQLRAQVQTLLEERENAPRQRHKTLVQVLEMETGRKLQHVKNWPQLTKMLRQELRVAKAAAEMPALKMKLVKMSGKHEQALARIKFLEQTLAAERARFEASDSGKSTANSAPEEPAHEVANLIDDYKKLIQQTAQETGRPRNSYILELIERSQRCQPNLCQLSNDLEACREDMLDLNKLLANLEPSSARQAPVPSLMEELRAVAEQT